MESEALLDFVGQIYDASLDADLWPAILERACLYVGGATAAIYWQSPVENSAEVFFSYRENLDYTKLYVQKYAPMNPLYPAMTFVEPGVVTTSEELMPHEEFRETRFFKEWVEPQGIIDAACVNLQRYATSSASFSIRRFNEQGVFDSEACRRMSMIAPHIRRAVLIGRQIARSDSRASDFEAVLDASAAAVFLVGEGGRLVFANEAGRPMLDAGTVVAERNGVFMVRDASANRQLREAASGVLPATEGRRSISIALTETAPRWLADVLPLQSGNRLSVGLEYRAQAAIFVRRAEIPSASGIEIMTQIYKLRASEIRVLHAMTTGGGSVEDIADVVGISSGTVKTHLNALFAKTGTSRRVDLLREVAAHGGPLL